MLQFVTYKCPIARQKTSQKRDSNLFDIYMMKMCANMRHTFHLKELLISFEKSALKFKLVIRFFAIIKMRKKKMLFEHTMLYIFNHIKFAYSAYKLRPLVMTGSPQNVQVLMNRQLFNNFFINLITAIAFTLP